VLSEGPDNWGQAEGEAPKILQIRSLFNIGGEGNERVGEVGVGWLRGERKGCGGGECGRGCGGGCGEGRGGRCGGGKGRKGNETAGGIRGGGRGGERVDGGVGGGGSGDGKRKRREMGGGQRLAKELDGGGEGEQKEVGRGGDGLGRVVGWQGGVGRK